jgi:hypothetical protein
MPYDGRDAGETLGKLLTVQPARPRAIKRDIPVALESVVQMVMSREPAERPRSAMELEALLGVAEVQATPSGVGTGLEGRRPQQDGTLLLPHGAVAQAASLEKRAKRARPTAVFLTIASGMLGSTLGACLLRPLAELASSDVASALSAALGIVGALAGAGASLYRARAELAERWSSAPEIDAHNRRVGRALSMALITLGVGAVPLLALGALGEGGVHADVLVCASIALASTLALEISLRARAARA